MRLHFGRSDHEAGTSSLASGKSRRYENGIRSFWLNSFVSQWAAWKDTVLKYLNALGDTKKMQVVYNTRLGLLWEDRGDVQDEDTMLGRRRNTLRNCRMVCWC